MIRLVWALLAEGQLSRVGRSLVRPGEVLDERLLEIIP
jgi:hypothetical protein